MASGDNLNPDSDPHSTPRSRRSSSQFLRPQVTGVTAVTLLSLDKIPLLHLKCKVGNTYEYSGNLTSVYLDILHEIATSGTTFKDKNALLTGVGKGSIGVEVVKGLLFGGAHVVITTLSYSRTCNGSAIFRSIRWQALIYVLSNLSHPGPCLPCQISNHHTSRMLLLPLEKAPSFPRHSGCGIDTNAGCDLSRQRGNICTRKTRNIFARGYATMTVENVINARLETCSGSMLVWKRRKGDRMWRKEGTGRTAMFCWGITSVDRSSCDNSVASSVLDFRPNAVDSVSLNCYYGIFQ